MFAHIRHGAVRVMTRVLIAVDESDASIAAAHTAHELFGDAATYLLVNVAPMTYSASVWGYPGMEWGVAYPVTLPIAGSMAALPVVAEAGGASIDDGDTTAADVAEIRARTVAERADLPADADAVGEVGGDIATAILHAAEVNDADLIVVGSHQRGWFSRLFSPSVSDALVRESTLPVLIAARRHDG